MRHHKKGRKFGRKTNVRGALIKSLLRSLVLHERISTTEAKAKEIRPKVEKMITRAMVDTVANRRLLKARLGDDTAVAKLFTTIAPRMKDRKGGYTRIVKRSTTATDGRSTAYIALV
jgi:large subunit ribosomal protein L17